MSKLNGLDWDIDLAGGGRIHFSDSIMIIENHDKSDIIIISKDSIELINRKTNLTPSGQEIKSIIIKLGSGRQHKLRGNEDVWQILTQWYKGKI